MILYVAFNWLSNQYNLILCVKLRRKKPTAEVLTWYQMRQLSAWFCLQMPSAILVIDIRCIVLISYTQTNWLCSMVYLMNIGIDTHIFYSTVCLCVDPNLEGISFTFCLEIFFFPLNRFSFFVAMPNLK